MITGEIVGPAQREQPEWMPGRGQPVLDRCRRLGGRERAGGVTPGEARPYEHGRVLHSRPVGQDRPATLRDGQRLVGLRPSSGETEPRALEHREPRILQKRLGREALESPQDPVRPVEIPTRIGEPLRRDERSCPIDLAGGERVTHGSVRVSLLREPFVGTPVELRHERGLALGELGAQEVGEELVVPVPLAPVVEGDQEEIGALELGEPLGRPALAGDRIAERSGERVENRGLQKEVAPACVERAEDDLREVVDDVAVRAVESRHEPVGIGRVTQRERRQVDPGRPTLGARVEDIQRLGRRARGRAAR